MKNVISRRDFLKGAAAAAAGGALFGLSSAPAFAEEAAADGKQEVYILYTNDVHCGVDDHLGYVSLMTAKAQLQALGKNVLLFDSGDFIQGDLIGTISKGKYIVDIMNLAGYDAVTVGNHEFDYGLDNLFELVKGLDPHVVCCNMTGPDGGNVFDGYCMLDAGGWKLGIVGCTTPTTLTSSTPKFFQDDEGNFIYDFCYDTTGDRLAEAVQMSIDAAKAEGAEKIIVLGHIGVDPENTGNNIYADLQSNILIGKTEGIDLFLDGHSHTQMPMELVAGKDGHEAVLTQTGTKLAKIGVAVLSPDGSITSRLVDDAGMKDLINEIEEDMNDDLSKVIATAEYPLYITDANDSSTRLVRKMETNLGDFCADAVLAACNADAAFVNGGGVRVDLPAGEITYGDLINVNPFGNQICVRNVTGAELLDALELSASQLPAEFGGFLQVSGISYTIDTSIPTPVVLDENGMFESVDGERRVKEVYIQGEPLEEEKTYSIASLSYILANGGNGYTMFHGEFTLEAGPLDSQTLCSYAQDTLGGVIGEQYENPLGDGRIVIE